MTRRGIVASTVIAVTIVAAATPQTVELSSDMRLAVVGGRDLVLEARPRKGEGWEEIARRVGSGPESAAAIAAASGGGEPGAREFVRVPFLALSGELRALVLLNLFPSDRIEDGAWVHVAKAGVVPTYDEGLWQVAAWFAGDGARFEEIGRVNGLASPDLARGQVVRIPVALLHPSLRPRPTSDDGGLVYDRDAQGDYAGYRLKPGEALWSSVVVRFTGRTAADDVEAVARDLAVRSGIRDTTDIPVGWIVKIPLDLLDAEFLPPGHPRRVEAEADRAAAEAELAKRPARGGALRDVVVIIDPGHGGKDVGTEQNGVWEHDHVYDIAVRLKKKIEAEAGATVHLTLVDEETGIQPSKGDSLLKNLQGTIRTNPPFLPKEDGDASIGVNLRWYLANSLYRKALHDGTDPDRVVFLSIHADARHPALRGAMVYIPGARYRTRVEGSSSATYRRFSEVRERDKVSFNRQERLLSEAVSRRLAKSLVREFERSRVPVQDHQPIRDKIIRGRRTWVPAVLRGNAVPAKVLVEVLNLANRQDAKLVRRASERQRIADALAAGLTSFFKNEKTAASGRGGARGGTGAP